MAIAHSISVVGSLFALLKNRLGIGDAEPLGTQEISCVQNPDRRLVILGHEPIAGFERDLGVVADQAAMLALHTLDSTTLIAEPTFVAPGDSCTRADDPGWRWHCMRGHGTALADWERRPLGGALEGLAVSGHTHAISAITNLQPTLEALDTAIGEKQDALANATALGYIAESPAGAPLWKGGTWPGGGSSDVTLATEILADLPTAYWRCNEASGAVLDSAGGGYDLTVSGTPIRSFARLARGLSDEHTRWANGYASRSGTLGITPPWSGSWSLRFLALLPDALAGEQGAFAVGLTGQETEASNYQLYASITTGRLPALVWEYSAGANVVFSPGADLTLGRRADVVWTKDAAAKIVRCYVNGSCVFVATYTQEPTGGGSSIVDVGRNSNNGTVGGAVIGHIAIYYGSVLTPARVQAHAEAAGVM